MIPQIAQAPGIDQKVLDFLQSLAQQGFRGDIDTRYATRLTMATDNSVYQLLPDAVVFPRGTPDVALVAYLARQACYRSLAFTPRGGGTGTNGQALNRGIIIDMSRHMNRILDINLQQGWVRLEAGVIKDQLNQYLQPLGYFFSPELSTSNRATLGGMINTDASGQGSLVYGKTSDHVLGLRSVLLGGELLDTAPIPLALAKQLASQETLTAALYRRVLAVCHEHNELIREKFPPLNRFLTGYDLRHVLTDDGKTVDLSRLLTGSEGTLAFITEATLHITPLPKVRRLVNIKYDSFDAALRNAPLMVEAQALSVETVDSKVLDLARQDIIWHSVRELIVDVPDKLMLGLNIVEFAGDDAKIVDEQVSRLSQRLEKLMLSSLAGVIGYQMCANLAEIERIYAMRKKAVGLLGNTSGAAKPLPFVEDTCVPPQHLADYISEFRALLDKHQLSYGMFGHVDAGVLHVRPALDMCDPQQEILLKTLSDQVVALTAKYGGLLWGEHGKGFRAQYGPDFFGETLFYQLRRIKTVFDPDNQLNPGKICTSLASNTELMQVDAVKRGSYDRTIPVKLRDAFSGVMACNGNGLCFNFDLRSPMCPSMKIHRDRIHSPKGRAALMREWLRLMAQQGEVSLAISSSDSRISVREWIEKIRYSWRARQGEYDFSHEVKQAMSGCLACKACSTQCPIKIDVPDFRARFLQLYHTRYLRPLRDHVIAKVESYTPVMAKAPKLFNFLIRQTWVSRFCEKYLGLVDLPPLSTPSLQQLLLGHRAYGKSLEDLEKLSSQQRQQHVLIVQDPFTSYYDAPVVNDFVCLVEKLGFEPVLLPFSPNGKAQHIKGFLQSFTQTATKTAHWLNRLARLEMPLVGIDPALVLCYRDEYQAILGNRRGNFTVLLVQEWLARVLPATKGRVKMAEAPWYLLGHCTETTSLPTSEQQWQQIFALNGAKLETIPVGCCGMAGTYGHETHTKAYSLGIYGLSWQQALQHLPPQRCLASGYSCRSQVKRVEGKRLRHPLQALLEILS